MKVDFWGYDKVAPGMGAMGPTEEMHWGYGVVTCDCGQPMCVWVGEGATCTKCGGGYKFENGVLTVIPSKLKRGWVKVGSDRSKGNVGLHWQDSHVFVYLTFGGRGEWFAIPYEPLAKLAAVHKLVFDIEVEGSIGLADIDEKMKSR